MTRSIWRTKPSPLQSDPVALLVRALLNVLDATSRLGYITIQTGTREFGFLKLYLYAITAMESAICEEHIVR